MLKIRIFIRTVFIWVFAVTILQSIAAEKTEAARETISLDGTWQIKFDLENTGRKLQWQEWNKFSNLEGVRTIKVPSCWETIEQDYEGVGWYGRSFRVPETWKNKVVRLQFGAVNFRSEVWVNDIPVGFHDGGYTPFEFDISDLINPEKENFLIVRVIGPLLTRDVTIDGISTNDMPNWRGTIAGGIWQSVKLTATEKVFIRDVFIEPRIHDEVALVHLEIDNAGFQERDVAADLSVFNFRGSSSQVSGSSINMKVHPGISKVSIELPIEDPALWSPDDPHLYVTEIRLESDNETLDLVRTRFGMREFTIRDTDFYLNGEKIIIKSGFCEGLYPNTLATPPDEEFLRNELMLAKQAGFNALRSWRKPLPPPTLDICDEIGMCIIATPSIWRHFSRALSPHHPAYKEITPQMENWVAGEIEELVLRDRNHPSVIYWELFNEILRYSIGRLKHKMSIQTRALDPTRIIVDESGGWLGGANVYLPYSMEPRKINEIHTYLRSPVDEEIYDFFLSLGDPDKTIRSAAGLVEKPAPGKLNFISEIGYGGLPDLPANVKQYLEKGNPITPDYRYHKRILASLEEQIRINDLNSIYKNVSEFCLETQEIQAVGNKLQLEAARLNPNVDGYCLHAFIGGDWVFGAGILDLWRNPKKSFYTVQEANMPFYLAVHTNSRNIYAGREAVITISAINENMPLEGSLKVRILSEDNQVVFQSENPLAVETGIHKILEKPVQTTDLSGLYQITAEFVSDEGVKTAENSYEIRVFGQEELQIPVNPVAVIDPSGTLGGFFVDKGMDFTEFTPGLSSETPVFVSEIIPGSQTDEETYSELIEFIREGGTAIYLNPFLGKPGTPEAQPVTSREVFPIEFQTRRATGHWVSVAHVVKDHPIFNGLPSNIMMSQEFQNVIADITLTGLSGKSLVVALSWDYYRNYLGPRKFWSGSDLSIIPYGDGKLILSSLKILENLDKDPVADRILYNLIEYTTTD